MSNNTTIQERFKSFCFYFEKRKNSRQKNKTLYRLCEMFKQLGYSVQIVSTKSKIAMTKHLFVGNPTQAKTILVAPYDVGEKMLVKDYIYTPFKMSDCRKKEMLNIQLHLLFSAALTLGGVLIIFFAQQTAGVSKIALSVLGVVPILLSFFNQGMQSRYNLSKTSSLFVMLELARDIHTNEVAFCLCDEGGYAKAGLDSLNQMIENLKEKEIIYLDCLAKGKEIIIGTTPTFKIKLEGEYPKPIRYYPISDQEDCALRYFDKAIQIVAADIHDGIAEVKNIANKMDHEAEIKNMTTAHDWILNYITKKEKSK